MPDKSEIYGLFLAWCYMAVAGAVLFGGGWLLFARRPRRLFGPQRFRAVPWRGMDIVLVFFLVYFLIPAALFGIIRQKSGPLPEDLLVAWISVLALPLQIAAILFVLSAGTGTRCYQLGLSTHRLAANLFLGFLTWLLLTPVVYGVGYLAIALNSRVFHAPPETHRLLELLQKNPGFLNGLLVFLSAVVAAPLCEELLFRGVLQPWVARRRWGPDMALVAAFGFALYTGFLVKVEKIFPIAGNPQRFRAAVEGLAPAAFVLLMIPGYIFADRLLWNRLPHPGTGRTLYAVALFFAAGHPVWPSPIPLFVLGLGLGYLAYRTQSLVSSITVHVLFNGMTVLGEFLTAQGIPNP